MTNLELAQKAKDIALNYKTLYVYGCFGACLSPSNKARYTNNYDYNKRQGRLDKITKACVEGNVFGFDCVCLIKGLLWGWTGDKSKTYGGATYASNGVPDLSANGFFGVCTNKSSSFDIMEIGEAVWENGHIGIYVGDGLAVECTPIWKDGVQLTACNCNKPGYYRRNWAMHGRIPYITYKPQTATKSTTHENKTVPCPYKEPTYILNQNKYQYGKIKKGDNGVKWLQWHLKQLGIYKDDIDGFFGPITTQAVKKFQSKHKDINGKPLEVDGSVYILTRGALKVAIKK